LRAGAPSKEVQREGEKGGGVRTSWGGRGGRELNEGENNRERGEGRGGAQISTSLVVLLVELREGGERRR